MNRNGILGEPADRLVGDGKTAGIEDVSLAVTNIVMPASDTEVTATYTTLGDGNLPPPWVNADIGAPDIPGSAAYLDGNWTVVGSGGIFSTYDDFHFVYQPLNGNVEIIANVLDVASINEWATGGVMIRETLDGNSKSIQMAVSGTAKGGYVLDYRTETDGTTAETMSYGGEPEWVRLRRVGHTIYGYHSNDGSNWALVGSISITMDANVYVGLAVSENDRDDGASCTAKFQSVFVSTLGGPYALTVNSGTGDGMHDANDIVNIVADTPPAGQIFDVWTGDTAGIEDVSLADTNIVMPASNDEVTAT